MNFFIDSIWKQKVELSIWLIPFSIFGTESCWQWVLSVLQEGDDVRLMIKNLSSQIIFLNFLLYIIARFAGMNKLY